MFRLGKAKPTRQATRTLQTLRGIGQVFAGHELLCEARYSLSVNQGIVYSGSQHGAGATEISGTLVLTNSDWKWKPGTPLSLRMEDGRTAAFVTLAGKASASVYGIQVQELSKRT